MSRDISEKLEDINQQIGAARKHRTRLETELKHNKEMLDDRQSNDTLYGTLTAILEHINKLDKLGGASLLWGNDYSPEHVTKNKQRIVSLLHDYDQQLSKTHEQKVALEQELSKLEISTNALLARRQILHDEIIARQPEFVIERKISLQLTRSATLPWSSLHNDVIRLRVVMLVSLTITVVIGYMVTMWEIPEPKRIEYIEIPERLARLVVKKTPPPPEPAEEKKLQEEPEPADETAPDDQKTQDARTVAESSGLLAYRQEFSDIIDASSNIKLGSQAAISQNTLGQSRSRQGRSLITSKVQLSSSDTSRSSVKRTVVVADNNLKKVTFSHIESPISPDEDNKPQSKRDNTIPVRSDEEIQVVFDRYKDALYRIYNRELRKKPLLKGKLVLRLTIDSSGKVTDCIIDSSDLDAPDLEKKIVARVLRFNFGITKGAASLTILYPIDFLPAS